MQRLPVLVGRIVLLAGGPAFAQDTSRGEFSAGLRYYHATLSSVVRPIQVSVPKNQPKGWYADAAANLSPKFAIVGEAGGTYFSDESTSGAGAVSIHESYDLTLYTFMGGVRVRAPQLQWFVPFGQVLFGAERDNSSDERTITVFQNTSKSSQE